MECKTRLAHPVGVRGTQKEVISQPVRCFYNNDIDVFNNWLYSSVWIFPIIRPSCNSQGFAMGMISVYAVILDNEQRLLVHSVKIGISKFKLISLPELPEA